MRCSVASRNTRRQGVRILVQVQLAAAVLQSYAAADVLKGVGLSVKRGFSDEQLRALQVSWYYNWSPNTSVNTTIPFVPMVFSPASLAGIGSGHEYVLGFNEPDNTMESNMNVSYAVSLWPQVRNSGKFVGAPATATNPVTPGNWEPQFMGNVTLMNLSVDFMTLHWYKGVDPKLFISDLNELCSLYGLPVWITEFASQTYADSQDNPALYSQAQVNNFINQTVAWMNSPNGSSCVQRYAWHDSTNGTSALFFPNGTLTFTGEFYASVGNNVHVSLAPSSSASPSLSLTSDLPNTGGAASAIGKQSSSSFASLICCTATNGGAATSGAGPSVAFHSPSFSAVMISTTSSALAYKFVATSRSVVATAAEGTALANEGAGTAAISGTTASAYYATSSAHLSGSESVSGSISEMIVSAAATSNPTQLSATTATSPNFGLVQNATATAGTVHVAQGSTELPASSITNSSVGVVATDSGGHITEIITHPVTSSARTSISDTNVFNNVIFSAPMVVSPSVTATPNISAGSAIYSAASRASANTTVFSATTFTAAATNLGTNVSTVPVEPSASIIAATAPTISTSVSRIYSTNSTVSFFAETSDRSASTDGSSVALSIPFAVTYSPIVGTTVDKNTFTAGPSVIGITIPSPSIPTAASRISTAGTSNPAVGTYISTVATVTASPTIFTTYVTSADLSMVSSALFSKSTAIGTTVKSTNILMVSERISFAIDASANVDKVFSSPASTASTNASVVDMSNGASELSSLSKGLLAALACLFGVTTTVLVLFVAMIVWTMRKKHSRTSYIVEMEYISNNTQQKIEAVCM